MLRSVIHYAGPADNGHGAMPAQTLRYKAERVFYSAEKYGCVENFESSKDFIQYIEQIKKDLQYIAKKINYDDSSDASIWLFYDNFHQCQNVKKELKNFLYTDLSHYFNCFKQLEFSHVLPNSLFIKTMLSDILDNLKRDVKKALEDIISLYEIINSPSKKKISQHVNNRIEKISHGVITQHVQSYHECIGDQETEHYIEAYKQHLKKANWIYPLQCKHDSIKAYIECSTKENFYILLAQLNKAINIVNIIKEIGNTIRKNIVEIFNKPGNHADVGDMSYLSQRGHQEILRFMQSTSLPVDLSAILGRNAAQNYDIYLLEYADALYGALAEALVAENNEGNIYTIESIRISPRSTIKAFRNLFWVDHGEYREPVTLQALHMGNINRAISDDLLRDAIINSPEKSLLKYYRSGWCGDVSKVLNDFFCKNIYLLSMERVNKDIKNINITDNNGNTLLHAMIYHDDKDAYNDLKDELKFLINAKNKSGTTALMQAAAKGWAFMVLDLLEHENIHFDAIDKNGHSAFEIALKNQHEMVLQILKSYQINFDSRKRKPVITDRYLSGANGQTGLPPKLRRVQRPVS